MWIRNLPTDYHKQQSDFDNLVFLWKTNNVYVMDNHLAAAWCWMQGISPLQRKVLTV